MKISIADLNDANEILSLQKRAFIQEAELGVRNYNIPPLLQDIESMKEDLKCYTILKAKRGNLIVGSVRAKQTDSVVYIGRLCVEPIFQKKGIGKKLLEAIEKKFSKATTYELFTGAKSLRNRAFYKNAGYTEIEEFVSPEGVHLVKLRKSC